MSAVYQPIVIRALLRAPGRSLHRDELARELAANDPASVARYRDILMRWPKLTLTRRHVVRYDKSTKAFTLLGVPAREHDANELAAICDELIDRWARANPVKVASIRYQMLEQADGRCEACGILAASRQLDVDQIVPQSKAVRGHVTLRDGRVVPVDTPENLQILCSKCNRGKRDQGQLDFRVTAERLAETLHSTARLAAKLGLFESAAFGDAIASLSQRPTSDSDG